MTVTIDLRQLTDELGPQNPSSFAGGRDGIHETINTFALDDHPVLLLTIDPNKMRKANFSITEGVAANDMVIKIEQPMGESRYNKAEIIIPNFRDANGKSRLKEIRFVDSNGVALGSVEDKFVGGIYPSHLASTERAVSEVLDTVENNNAIKNNRAAVDALLDSEALSSAKDNKGIVRALNDAVSNPEAEQAFCQALTDMKAGNTSATLEDLKFILSFAPLPGAVDAGYNGGTVSAQITGSAATRGGKKDR